MICRAINLTREIWADLSSPTNEAVKLLLRLHVSLWMNLADRSRTPPILNLKAASERPMRSRDPCRRSTLTFLLDGWRGVKSKSKTSRNSDLNPVSGDEVH